MTPLHLYFTHRNLERIKSLIPADESLTPGALYVGVATLTGSVLTRNRTIFLRFSLPPALFLLSMNQFLPKTSHNVSEYLSLLEQAHAPALAEAHSQFNESIASTTLATRLALNNARVATVSGAERIVAQIQDTTGLKLREALGWGQKVAGDTKADAKDVVKRAEEAVRK